MSEDPSVFRKTPDSKWEVDAFHGGAFQVFYGGVVPRVVYIELSSGPDIEAEISGHGVFTTPADELVTILRDLAPFDASDPELGYSYVFPDLDLAVWRPVVPEDAEDEGGRYFSTIGVGVAGYFGA